MNKSIALSVSVLNANFMKLEESLKSIDPYADSFHVDIMDGTFTPIISFGTWMIPVLKKIVKAPLEVHLYVRNPFELFSKVLELGASRVLMNQESISKIITDNLVQSESNIGLFLLPRDSADDLDIELLEYISLINVVSVNSLQGGQEISWDLVEKSNMLDNIRIDNGFDFDISIDGGINEEVLRNLLDFPIDQVVIGSAIFSSDNPPASAENIRHTFLSSRFG